MVIEKHRTPPMAHAVTQNIKEAAQHWGADLVGIADVAAMQSMPTCPPGIMTPFSHAVSIAVKLPVAVFDTIEDKPTPEYNAVYQTANRLLDDIAFKTSRMLQDNGGKSLPIPASQIVDRSNWLGAVSHKAVARMAGLGWQGKNLLLITPEYGSRVRLVTVLTDVALEADTPIKNRCGKCSACRDACPVGAIKGVSITDHYENREEALYFSRCLERLMQHTELSNIDAPICGICIKVCPFGKKIKKKKERV